jgi:asparagine synthase (glutamine-hydrolysing)
VCGIAGFFGLGGPVRDAATVAGVLSAMGAVLTHRGPDDAGCWTDPDREIALVHRRLSIVDISAAGHQPMFSPSGRYVVVFNGEIYNHREIRADILRAQPQTRFRGHSDTEVLLVAIELWGELETLRRCNGMFAFALFDRTERLLHLARDRVGEKPLYYGFTRSALVFGSELRALRCHPECTFELDHEALWAYLREGYVPAPRSIAAGIGKVMPGTLLTLGLPEVAARAPQVRAYWSAFDSLAEQPANGEASSQVDALEALLRDSVRLRMEADVPLGAFLSGGIDSSTVVALMQAQASRPVKTFSIGTADKRFDEAAYAKAVANHLRTDHTELYLTAAEVLDTVPLMPQVYDEPFADSSQIPTYLVAKLARTQVTVSLSGDGGDELFAGYGRYTRAMRLWRAMRMVPQSVRNSLSSAVTAVPVGAWNRMGTALPDRYTDGRFGDRLHKAMLGARLSSFDAVYQHMLSLWPNPSELLLTPAASAWASLPPQASSLPVAALDRMMKWDFLRYLPDDILVKVDRASMAVSLEGRMPLLDHRLVEFAWRLPEQLKVQEGQTKWLLRQVLYRYVPRRLIDRPKMGFAVPIDSWLRTDLREWAGDLLSRDALRRDGIFDVEAVQAHWRQHLSGERSWAAQLWTILMFQAWRQGFGQALAPHIAPPLAAAPGKRAAGARLQGIGSAH